MPKIFTHALGSARVLYAPGKEIHFVGGVFALQEDHPDYQMILEQFEQNPNILPLTAEEDRISTAQKLEALEASRPKPKRRLLKEAEGFSVNGVAPEVSFGGLERE